MNRKRSTYSDLFLVGCGLLKSISSDTTRNNVISTCKPSLPSVVSAKSIAIDESSMVEQKKMRPSRLPSSRLSRIYEYTKLGVGLAAGTMGAAISRTTSRKGSTGSLVGSESNINRLVSTLSRMRGAALKIGQMLSINEIEGVPPEIQTLLTRLQNSADYMIPSQMESVMKAQLGSNWREEYFKSFEDVPIAAASIGQVHRATMKDGAEVAVKIQYPGVSDSVISDLDNLALFIKFGDFLPKGLFLENTIKVAKEELHREMDYIYEADAIEKFQNLLRNEHREFGVPSVYRNVTTSKVLTTSLMPGIPLGSLIKQSQRVRDKVAENILKLCLRELFEFRFMQTDPNWSNFLFDARTEKINLIDFGASREFSEKFTSLYRQLLISAAKKDREKCVEYSIALGFLTGAENKEMINAHLDSLMTLATPFGTPGYYDFSRQTVSSQVRNQIPTMLKYRLTPPPNESYSLHRKLSGCFLLCSKLNSKVRCQSIFKEYI